MEIRELTSQHQTQFETIWQRWRSIAPSTRSIDPNLAIAVVTEAYQMLGYPDAEILVFDSPRQVMLTIIERLIQTLEPATINRIEAYLIQAKAKKLESETLRFVVSQMVTPLQRQLTHLLGQSLRSSFTRNLIGYLNHQVQVKDSARLQTSLEIKHRIHEENQRLHQVVRQQQGQLNSQLILRVMRCLKERFHSPQATQTLDHLYQVLQSEKSRDFANRVGNFLGRSLFHNHCIPIELWIVQSSWIEFCRDVWNLEIDFQRWSLVFRMILDCGWIFPWEAGCFICDRPLKLELDQNHRLHSEGGYAVLFGDGYGQYFYHGVALPEQYGRLLPRHWKSDWLMQERNAELRRILLEAIGYERVCTELHAVQIDAWNEYALLRFDAMGNDIDGYPMVLLKMICPSTQHIHAIRVPPNMQSARDAICWINHGIAPERFLVQS